MRLKVAAFVGLAALLVSFTGCGDPNRSSYVKYSPAPNSSTSPSSTNR